jgi:hypothetical protein
VHECLDVCWRAIGQPRAAAVAVAVAAAVAASPYASRALHATRMHTNLARTCRFRCAAAERAFTFDTVLDTSADQARVYAATGAPILGACLRGFNGCVLAVSATASGARLRAAKPRHTLRRAGGCLSGRFCRARCCLSGRFAVRVLAYHAGFGTSLFVHGVITACRDRGTTEFACYRCKRVNRPAPAFPSVSVAGHTG